MKINFIIFLFLCLTVFEAMAQSSQEEKITITTYYPSPYGVYNQLVTRTLGVGDTNNDNQLDSRDAPNPNTNPGDVYISGNVGIGTINPLARLDVFGGIRVGTTNVTCNSNTAGTLRYNNTQIEYCNGTEWRSAFQQGLPKLCYCVQSTCCDGPGPGTVQCAELGNWTAFAGSGARSGCENCAGYGHGEMVRIRIYPCQ